MKGKAKLVLIIPVLVAGGVLAYLYVTRHLEKPSGVIRVSGNMEVTDVELSFRIPGWVDKRPVDEGDSIQKDQLVAALDANELSQEVVLRQHEVDAAKASLDELLAGSRPQEIAAAEQAVKQAQAALDELLAGSRPQEIASARAALASAQAEADFRKIDLNRVIKLNEANTATQQELDLARTAYEVARARAREADERLKLVVEGPRTETIAQARAALNQAKEKYDLVKQGPRVETIAQARARLRQANQALSISRTQRSYCTLSSPVNGVVLSKNVEPGEFVAAGTPIVTVADLGNIWLRAYVSETELGLPKLGDKATITTDTYPGKKYTGRITFIADQAEFTPKNVQTPAERVKLVYRVKITVPNPDNELKPGMPADAEIILTR